MCSSILCRERLDRIQRILSRLAGALSVREFARSFSVGEWEIEQAAVLGWLKIETRELRTGRPSRIAKIASESQTAKLPPYRRQIEKQIGKRHQNFALLSAHCGSKDGSNLFFSRPSYTGIYLRSYADAKSRRGAAASMSRLLRRYDVRAARAWHYTQIQRKIPRDEPMPQTASAIWQRLLEVGSMFER